MERKLTSSGISLVFKSKEYIKIQELLEQISVDYIEISFSSILSKSLSNAEKRLILLELIEIYSIY